MNANRKMTIDFRIMTKRPDGTFTSRHDHYIEPNHGKSIKKRATKKR